MCAIYAFTSNSSEKALIGEQNNLLSEVENEENIMVQSTRRCYKIVSKANHFNSLKHNYRTFTITFADHLSVTSAYPHLPPRVIIYATSYENSFGAQNKQFYHGKPHITQIPMNHHAKVSFKAKQTHYSKEKNPNCEELTWFEKLEELFVPAVKEGCPYPCTPLRLPGNALRLCETKEEVLCSSYILDDQRLNLNYSFDSCSLEEYVGTVLENDIIEGKPKLYDWHPGDLRVHDVVYPWYYYFGDNPGNTTVKFSYTFDNPETMIREEEYYIATFVDLIGIVGGTLSMFIGFAFYDNILSFVEYLIMIVNLAKRFKFRKKVAPKAPQLFTKVQNTHEDVGSEVAPEADPEVAPKVDPVPEVDPEAAPEAAPDPVPEVDPEAAPEPAPEPAPEVDLESVPEMAPEVTKEKVTDEIVNPEVVPKVPPECPQEMASE